MAGSSITINNNFHTISYSISAFFSIRSIISNNSIRSIVSNNSILSSILICTIINTIKIIISISINTNSYLPHHLQH